MNDKSNFDDGLKSRWPSRDKRAKGIKKQLADFSLITLSVILFFSGVVNLKNFREEISLLDISFETLFLPLIWMVFIALGIHFGVAYFKRRVRS